MNSALRRFRRRLGMTSLRQPIVRWRHRSLSPDDVLLASYPKSGNTWMKHLLVYLLTGDEHGFHGSSDPKIPSVGHPADGDSLRCGLGQIFKTHEPYRGEYQKAIYVVRDGRDVAVSNYWYLQREIGASVNFDSFFRDFLAGHSGPYGAWHQHVRSWMDADAQDGPNILLVRYEDLLQDAVTELERVAEFLNLDTSREVLQDAVQANSFASMKKREQSNQLSQTITTKTGIPFVRKGTAGQWQEQFSSTQLKAFHKVAGDVLQELGYET